VIVSGARKQIKFNTEAYKCPYTISTYGQIWNFPVYDQNILQVATVFRVAKYVQGGSSLIVKRACLTSH